MFYRRYKTQFWSFHGHWKTWCWTNMESVCIEISRNILPEKFFHQQLLLIAFIPQKKKKFLDWFQTAKRWTHVLTAVTSPTSFVSTLLSVRQICYTSKPKTRYTYKHLWYVWQWREFPGYDIKCWDRISNHNCKTYLWDRTKIVILHKNYQTFAVLDIKSLHTCWRTI